MGGIPRFRPSVEKEQAGAGRNGGVLRGQILRRERGQGNINVSCSGDHEQDWQPHPIDPYSALRDYHMHLHIHQHCIVSKEKRWV